MISRTQVFFDISNLRQQYFNYIDLTLYDKAVQKNIPIDSLETIGDEINAITHGVTLGELASYAADSAKSWMVNYIKDVGKDITQDKQPTGITEGLTVERGIYNYDEAKMEWKSV